MTDLRDQLQAAYEEHAGPAEGAAAPITPDPVVEAAPPAVAEAGAEKTPPAAETGPARDEHGKFVPKTPAEPSAAAPAEPTASAEPTPPAEPEPQTEATRVPAFLPAALKAEWGSLPPQWQSVIAKQEESVQAAKAEWGKKGERLNRLDEILAPRRERLLLNGIDESTWLQRLAAAEDVLERNPVEGFHYLARLYGVDLRTIAGQASGPGQQPQPQTFQGQPAPAALDPNLAPIFERFQALEATIESQAKSAEAAAKARDEAEVTAFGADPAHLYFENVRPAMAQILSAGLATSLNDAYEMAIWASPEIRPLLQKAAVPTPSADPAAIAKKAADDAARKKAADAQRSSGSVTGAPTPGAGPAAAAPRESIRAELLAAVETHGARL